MISNTITIHSSYLGQHVRAWDAESDRVQMQDIYSGEVAVS